MLHKWDEGETSAHKAYKLTDCSVVAEKVKKIILWMNWIENPLCIAPYLSLECFQSWCIAWSTQYWLKYQDFRISDFGY